MKKLIFELLMYLKLSFYGVFLAMGAFAFVYGYLFINDPVEFMNTIRLTSYDKAQLILMASFNFSIMLSVLCVVSIAVWRITKSRVAKKLNTLAIKES